MKSFLFAIAVCALVGCSGLKPVGPLAQQKPITQQGQPLPAAPADRPQPARPGAPTALVKPADVASDPQAAAAKLTSELAADSKSLPNAPVTAEVSRIQGGVRQN